MVRQTVQIAFRRGRFQKSNRSSKILGCTFEFFCGYIESLFKPGMSWENRSLWQVDHIVPMATATTMEEAEALNHYTNFQPLWTKENQMKGAKMPNEISFDECISS